MSVRGRRYDRVMAGSQSSLLTSAFTPIAGGEDGLRVARRLCVG